MIDPEALAKAYFDDPSHHGVIKFDDLHSHARRYIIERLMRALEKVSAAKDSPPPTTIVRAPFTAEQVYALLTYQTDETIHPFTCGIGGHAHGILMPTVRGWVCHYCDYTQSWAHTFMTTWVPKKQEIP